MIRRKAGAIKPSTELISTEAEMLWHDVDRLEVPAKNVSEPRFAMIGRIGDKVWTAFITYRGDIIRFISVRRARTNEIEAYERT